MSTDVRSCAPDDSLETAARAMWDHDCGSLPVCGGDGDRFVVGMITDRDICMSALFEGKPLHELPVSGAMSRDVRTCHAEDSPAEVERMMREAQVRRVPVVDGTDSMVGIVSLADLARRRLGAGQEEPSELGVGDTLSAICEPDRHRVAAA